MDLAMRSEILSSLYQEQAHLANLVRKCDEAKALSVYTKVVAAKQQIDDALSELKPDEPQADIGFARRKYD